MFSLLVVKINSNKLYCKICESWIHLRCSGLNKREFNTLDKHQKDSWFCKWCLVKIVPFNKIDNKTLIKLFKVSKTNSSSR